MTTAKAIIDGDTITCGPLSHRRWSAWVDMMPIVPPSVPKPLIVMGEVQLRGSPAEAALVRASPQGTSESHLILDLVVRALDSPGDTSEWTPVRFSEPYEETMAREVHVRYRGELIATLEVKFAH
ncbi:MAG: hypothetical protein ACE366_21485 [Bradymonadia bacterium]